MGREINRLTARGLKGLAPGLHNDGGNLYLLVEEGGAQRWVFKFRFQGKRCEMGLGPVSLIPLAEAREAAHQALKLVKAGKSPIAERRRQRAAVRPVTFGDLADQVVADIAPQWKNWRSEQQWRTTLTVDAASLRPKLVSEITTDDVLAVLKPIWLAKPVTASRLRGRVERILDAARARGIREGENPARWRGHLSILLPRRLKAPGHHAALPYDQIRPFMARIRQSDSISAKALEFTILTVGRTSEALFATGAEIDLQQAVWTVSGDRMKSGRDHRVPLSDAALAIARERIDAGGAGYLFPGLKRGRPLSNMAMCKILKLTGNGNYTVHGFRSTFRDWAGDKTAFPREIIEAAMAHVVGDEAEQAYRRSDALERRRKLMNAWAQYCEAAAAIVIPIRA